MDSPTSGTPLLNDFSSFSTVHGLAVLASFLLFLCVPLIGVRAKSRSPQAEQRVRLGWIGLVVLVQAFTQLWVNLPSSFDPQRTLPLHICDLAPWLGIAALLSPSRLLRSLAYFWGCGLSVWALVLPVLSVGPAHLEFWLFWLGHAQIIATALYLVVVDQYRPDRRDFGLAAVCTVAYALLMIPLDIALSADYGYVGQRSPTAELGPWPARIPVLIALELLFFALLLLPWRFGRRGGTADSAVATDRELLK